MLSRFSFLILAVLIGSSSFAAEGTSESSSNNLMDSVYANFFTVYHGAPVTDLGSPYSMNAKGQVPTKNPSAGYFDSTITAAYLLNSEEGIGVGPYIPFFITPLLGQGATIGDVGITGFDKHILRTKDMNVSANLILQLPSSDYTKTTGMDLGVKTTPSVRYNIPSSRFSVGSWTEAKAYLGVYEKKKSFKLWAEPYVSYQATPKFSWNLGYEIESGHMKGTVPTDFTLVQTDLLPGFVYFFTPKVMVNPYLQIFTTEKVALDRTAVGAVISASL